MTEKSNGKNSPKIEVNFVLRDKNGNPTGKRRSFGSDNAKDLANFYNKHQAYRAKGKKGNGGGNSPKGKK
jgi:hypothetical protein